jgi:hypothetical protein
MQIVRQRKVLRKHASRSKSFHSLFIGLILIGEVTVSFTGGLIVRNPWLPNYLVDRVNGRSQVVANQTIKPPPPPSAAIEYVNLMNYDEKALTPAERSVASILNDAVAHLDIGKPPFLIFSEQILPKIETVQPGENLVKIRAAVQQCQDIADSAVHYYEEVSEQLTIKLKAAGLPAVTAQETAQTFAQWAQDVGKVPWPTEVNKACASITTLLDVLSKNSSQWTRQTDGHLLFTNQQLLDQYNAATTELNAAIKTINGG